MNSEGEEFGMERLRDTFAAARPKGAEEANAAVFAAVGEFAGDTPQSDDITCMTFHRNEK